MTDAAFDRDKVQCFRFVRCRFDADTGIAHLVYAFDDGPELVEIVSVPGAPFQLEPGRAEAVERALRLLHLVAGVSYYKAAVPPDIRIDGYSIDSGTAALLREVYVNGLGEFAYRNGLALHGRIRFPVSDALPSRLESGEGSGAFASTKVGGRDDSSPASASREQGEGAPVLGLRRHALTAIGGGKDSLVSIEALRAAGIEQTVAWIGSSQLIRTCAEHTGLPTLAIGRQLAPQLFEFNRQGAWNGHIPVTAINSAILVLAALLHDADQVVFSNEHSASYGSQIEGTGEVNHQWSKGWAFEKAFARHVRGRVAADLSYYSLLRPLSELAVARQFAKNDRYDAHFSSCNRNFHILGQRPVNRWCGVCPKCHFVFLALAPFLPKPRLMRIFGRNLLDDPAQVPGFDALLEYQGHKPFECVGEGRESRAAMAALSNRPEWREDAVVRRFAREILPQLEEAGLALAPLLELDDRHGIPPEVWNRLHARFAA
ncbi:UDP-N-acetyl-alpha-D-muramoyl-L-alanyl-L-glutamate epimerase [Luteimonas vadosa]|uniref:UDP-N-acetyl-alpha-D-muramoyl-L-alanyl-L-glutamate epimerase n=1 Tax=Luteimonas vadosa TaxID=1165507 RepID=A0ABP9DYG0_9GAMM